MKKEKKHPKRERKRKRELRILDGDEEESKEMTKLYCLAFTAVREIEKSFS